MVLSLLPMAELRQVNVYIAHKIKREGGGGAAEKKTKRKMRCYHIMYWVKRLERMLHNH